MANWIKHWSMTKRLSFYFAASSLVLTSIMGLYLYSMLDRQLDEEHSTFLADDIDALRKTLADEQPVSALAGHARVPGAVMPIGSRLHLRVFDETGRVLTSTPDMTVPAEVLPKPAALAQRADRSRVWKSPEGKYYRLVAAWANAGGVPGRKVLLALALDISLERRLLARYYETLIATMVVVVACAAIMGYVVTRQGLSPIRRITRTANEITSARLEKRIEIEDAPAELRDFAGAFNAMLDRLHDSFSRLSQFSSDIAHELRTPINNLMGEAQVTLARARTAAEYRETLESGLEELERLARMIEDMLFLARAEEPTAVISASRMNAREAVEKLAEFYQVMADERAVSIECSGEALVYADETLFRRAISNLLSNALQHAPRGGVITVALRGEPDGAATVTVGNAGDGIPREHLTRIFDRFFRVDASREKSGQGAGLGLAIVKTIMRLHGGSVEVTSEPGVLTTFVLRFPPRAAPGDVTRQPELPRVSS